MALLSFLPSSQTRRNFVLAICLFFGGLGTLSAQAGGSSDGQQDSPNKVASPNLQKKNNNNKNSDNSLSGRAATALCGCEAMKDLVALSAVMEDADEDKKMELAGQLLELLPNVEACIQPFVEESDKLSEADKAAFEKEFEEKMSNMCPDLMESIKGL